MAGKPRTPAPGSHPADSPAAPSVTAPTAPRAAAPSGGPPADLPDPGAAAELTPRRRAVLEALRAARGPLGVTDVAARLAVHANTVRFHLDALVADGHVERMAEGPSGPGRPRSVYTARRGMDRAGPRSYRLLARMLLSRMATAAPRAARAGAGAEAAERAEAAATAETGRAWGRSFVGHPAVSRPPTAREAVDRLTAMLADLGFDPQPAAAGPVPDRIRLRHCPFLELAEEYQQIVCPLHLALMQGALAELRAPLAATRLEPFAEPGACLAHLAPHPAPGTQPPQPPRSRRSRDGAARPNGGTPRT